jgi:predicted PurR-regulated permease PerM
MQSLKISSSTDSNLLRWIQYVVFISVILYFGKDLFVPLSFALLISFILYPVCRWLETKGIGRLMAITIALTFLIILGLLIFALLVSQFVSFIDEWPSLLLKLNQSFNSLSQFLVEVFGISKDRQADMLSKMSDQSGGNVLQIVKNMISASAFSVILLILIPVYAVLILYYRKYWMKILAQLFPGERSESLKEIISQSIRAYYNFVKGMGIVYVIVGILNSVGLLLLGVPHAILFGFIAAILTIVPYVGIIAGSLLPITMAWITYDSVWYPLSIIGIFAFVQYLEANVIFPIAVGNRLNVNTLVMLLVIFAGGILWGVAGMILFVPFVGIAKLIADHNPKWKTISMILGMEK